MTEAATELLRRGNLANCTHRSLLGRRTDPTSEMTSDQQFKKTYNWLAALAAGVIERLLVVTSTPSHVREDRRLPASVDRVHVGARRIDLVNAVEHHALQAEFGRAELGLQVLHSPRSDNRRSNGRVF